MDKVLATIIPVFAALSFTTMPFWLPFALTRGMKRQIRKSSPYPPGTKARGLYVRIK